MPPWHPMLDRIDLQLNSTQEKFSGHLREEIDVGATLCLFCQLCLLIAIYCLICFCRAERDSFKIVHPAEGFSVGMNTIADHPVTRPESQKK